jgi:hypothetical protein
MVNDLVDEPAQNMAGPSGSLSNLIDKETRNLAIRIKKCPHFKSYK